MNLTVEDIPNTAVIIQARMTSKRFPGKSMALLAGKPVLQHVVERCRMIPDVRVIVAMPNHLESLPMAGLCVNLGAEVFGGPEEDVLMRYYICAKTANLEYIVRITGDCPFIDPIICNEVLTMLKTQELDYASNMFPVRTYPKGLDCEAFTFDCLECAEMMGRQAVDREHVTPWMQRKEGLKRGNLRQKKDKSHLNWCVDYPEDISRLEALLNEAKLKMPLLEGPRSFTAEELSSMRTANARLH